MNKQEAISKIKENSFVIEDSLSRDSDPLTYIDDVIAIIEQLDDHPKVKVPMFVAEWIEFCKSKGNLTIALEAGNAQANDTDCWVHDNQELFARAWLDGYEVEREKKYNCVDSRGNIVLWKLDNEVTHEKPYVVAKMSVLTTDLTEKEIKDYDERYWAFAEEMEE